MSTMFDTLCYAGEVVPKVLGFGPHTIQVQATWICDCPEFLDNNNNHICDERRAFAIDVSATLVALLPAAECWTPCARVVLKERDTATWYQWDQYEKSRGEDYDEVRNELYDNEVAMYTKRLGPVQGRYVPRLLGQVTSGGGVPAMLLEYVEGTTLHNLPLSALADPRVLDVVRDRCVAACSRDPDEFAPYSDPYSHQIMVHASGFTDEDWVHPDLLAALRRALDGLTACGVLHRDAGLRNFIVRADPTEPHTTTSGTSGTTAFAEAGDQPGVRRLDVVVLDFGWSKTPDTIDRATYETNEHELREIARRIKEITYDEVARDVRRAQRVPDVSLQSVTSGVTRLHV